MPGESLVGLARRPRLRIAAFGVVRRADIVQQLLGVRTQLFLLG